MDNIYLKEETTARIETAFNTIVEAVASTLGPYGNNVLIQDNMGNHSFTKDGYSVLKRLYFTDDIEKTLLDLVKTISKKLVRTVGDGSTSSIVLAASLYSQFLIELKSLKDDNINIPPQELLNILNFIADRISNLIVDKSIKINDDNFDKIREIAKVSLNGNMEIADMIYEIYKRIGKDGFINIELSQGSTSYYESTNGFEL